MKGISKQFDKTLFEENDPLSRNAVKRFFLKIGYVLEDNQDQYGIDLVYKNGLEFVEVERRIVWDNYDFPFDEINLPQRKAKFFRNTKSHYAIVSKNYKRMGLLCSKSIQQYIEDFNLKESPNRLLSQNEFFYKLPKSKFIWVNIPA
jgi:hypothetical protein